MNSHIEIPKSPTPWNKGRLVGQKAPLRLKEIWAIRIRLRLADKARDLALFNLAIDSKLRGCDLVSLWVCDIAQGKSIFPRAMVMQRKTHRPVQFEMQPGGKDTVSWRVMGWDWYNVMCQALPTSLFFLKEKSCCFH